MRSVSLRSWVVTPLLLALTASLTWATAGSAGPAPARPAAGAALEQVEIPPVLTGDTWLRHHRDDLMPYWDMPEALGSPLGNFPSFRGRAGELLPESTTRGLSTLARGVYGYSLAFLLTGEERYLTYARSGLDWIEAKAVDREYGGYFGELDVNGDPVPPGDPEDPADPATRKDVFDLASVGMAYAMYFNVTRDPDAEAHLLAIRDLLFDEYFHDGTGSSDPDRVLDSLDRTLSTEVDTGNNGGDITNLLVPGTGMFLPSAALLTDPDRRVQFRADLRLLTEILIDRHKNSGAASPANRWMFWGRTGRFGNFNAAATDFGHNIKSYAMIHNASQMFADRPWEDLATDRTNMLNRAWDDAAARWNQRPRNFSVTNVERDSAWWIHDEADQLLAALDLVSGFSHTARLARSAQSFLDVYVDRDPAYPARETFVRVERTGLETDLRKSLFGKNMLHNPEHALILYLHGRALEGLPARLHYAFPAEHALSAVAKPYWFDATGESRTDAGPLAVLPGHRHVEVDLTGIGQVPHEPYPAPPDTTAPTTVAAVSPPANAAGWHRGDATVSLTATDDLVGVKEVHARVEDDTGVTPGVAFISPGRELTLPSLTGEGDFTVTWFAVDALGNREVPRTLRIRIDRTGPAVSGLPEGPCRLWPANGKMVHVADVTGSDSHSGPDTIDVTGTSSEHGTDDIRISGGSVDLRAERDGADRGREYTLTATVTDLAGNATTRTATCVVPHDRRR